MKIILIVDDHNDFRDMLREFLEAHDYLTMEATDGQQAVEEAARVRPDLILMELGLPETSLSG